MLRKKKLIEWKKHLKKSTNVVIDSGTFWLQRIVFSKVTKCNKSVFLIF
jgi:hypothetical protein